MSFFWTDPQPLTTTTALVNYFKELQDAVDTLRQSINQPPYPTWEAVEPDPLYGTKRTIKASHYTQLKTVINTLINNYGYNSVVDVLGRDWSDYYILKYGHSSAPYQLLQDFRDVLDTLNIKIEQWILTIDYIPLPTVEYDVGWGYGNDGWWSEGADKVVSVKGDIGLWTLTSINGQSHLTSYKKFGYPGEGGNVLYNVQYLPKDSPDAELAIDVIGYYEDQLIISGTATLYGWRWVNGEWKRIIIGYFDNGVMMSNESYMAEFNMECGEVPNDWGTFQGEFDKEIYLTSNSKFKIDMLLSGTPALVYNSTWESPPLIGTRTLPLLLSMRLFFHKIAKNPNYTGGQEIVDIIFTNQDGYDITSIYKKMPYSNMDYYFHFEELPFKSYWTGDSQEFDLVNYDYKWTGIQIRHEKAHQKLGSYTESLESGSYSQSGNIPNFTLIINNIGVIEVV